jgi:hypothetical protein
MAEGLTNRRASFQLQQNSFVRNEDGSSSPTGGTANPNQHARPMKIEGGSRQIGLTPQEMFEIANSNSVPKAGSSSITRLSRDGADSQQATPVRSLARRNNKVGPEQPSSKGRRKSSIMGTMKYSASVQPPMNGTGENGNATCDSAVEEEGKDVAGKETTKHDTDGTSDDTVISSERESEGITNERDITFGEYIPPNKASFLHFHPHDAARQRWDVALMSFIVYNSISIPLQLAFFENVSKEWKMTDIAVDIVFILDIAVNFLTAADIHGRIVFNFKIQALEYVRFWFWLDFVSGFPWFAFETDKSEDNESFTKVFRLLRLTQTQAQTQTQTQT